MRRPHTHTHTRDDDDTKHLVRACVRSSSSCSSINAWCPLARKRTYARAATPAAAAAGGGGGGDAPMKRGAEAEPEGEGGERKRAAAAAMAAPTEARDDNAPAGVEAAAVPGALAGDEVKPEASAAEADGQQQAQQLEADEQTAEQLEADDHQQEQQLEADDQQQEQPIEADEQKPQSAIAAAPQNGPEKAEASSPALDAGGDNAVGVEHNENGPQQAEQVEAAHAAAAAREHQNNTAVEPGDDKDAAMAEPPAPSEAQLKATPSDGGVQIGFKTFADSNAAFHYFKSVLTTFKEHHPINEVHLIAWDCFRTASRRRAMSRHLGLCAINTSQLFLISLTGWNARTLLFHSTFLFHSAIVPTSVVPLTNTLCCSTS